MNRWINLCKKFTLTALATLLVVLVGATPASADDYTLCDSAGQIDEPSLLASIIFSENSANTSADTARLSLTEIAQYGGGSSPYCYGNLSRSGTGINQASARLANRLQTMSAYGWFVPVPRSAESDPHWMTHALKNPTSVGEKALHAIIAIATTSGGVFDATTSIVYGFKDMVAYVNPIRVIGVRASTLRDTQNLVANTDNASGMEAVTADNETQASSGENYGLVERLIRNAARFVGFNETAVKIIGQFILIVLITIMLLTVIIALRGSRSNMRQSLFKARALAIRVVTIVSVIPVGSLMISVINEVDSSVSKMDDIMKRFASNYVIDTVAWAAANNLSFPSSMGDFSSTFTPGVYSPNHAPTRENVSAVARAIADYSTGDGDSASDQRSALSMIDVARQGQTASVNDYFAALSEAASGADLVGVNIQGAPGSLVVSGNVSDGRGAIQSFAFNPDETYFFAKPDENHKVASETARSSLAATQDDRYQQAKREVIEENYLSQWESFVMSGGNAEKGVRALATLSVAGSDGACSFSEFTPEGRVAAATLRADVVTDLYNNHISDAFETTTNVTALSFRDAGGSLAVTGASDASPKRCYHVKPYSSAYMNASNLAQLVGGTVHGDIDDSQTSSIGIFGFPQKGGDSGKLLPAGLFRRSVGGSLAEESIVLGLQDYNYVGNYNADNKTTYVYQIGNSPQEANEILYDVVKSHYIKHLESSLTERDHRAIDAKLDATGGSASNDNSLAPTTINVYGSRFDINRSQTPSAMVPRKVTVTNPTTYLYGAIPPGALDEYSISANNYTFGDGNHLSVFSPTDSDKVEADTDKQLSLKQNAIAIALLNKYQGSEGGKQLSNQSVAFLLQSDVSNGSLVYNGFNTASNQVGEAKNTGVNGNSFMRYVIPAQSVADMGSSMAGMAAVFVTSALLSVAILFILLKSPVFTSLLKMFKGFLKALFTGNPVEAIRFLMHTAVLRVAFITAGFALFIGGMIGQTMTDGWVGDLIAGLQTNRIKHDEAGGNWFESFGHTMASAGLNVLTALLLVALCALASAALLVPVLNIVDSHGTPRRVSLMHVIVTVPFIMASSAEPHLERLERRIFGSSNSGTGGNLRDKLPIKGIGKPESANRSVGSILGDAQHGVKYGRLGRGQALGMARSVGSAQPGVGVGGTGGAGGHRPNPGAPGRRAPGRMTPTPPGGVRPTPPSGGSDSRDDYNDDDPRDSHLGGQSDEYDDSRDDSYDEAPYDDDSYDDDYDGEDYYDEDEPKQPSRVRKAGRAFGRGVKNFGIASGRGVIKVATTSGRGIKKAGTWGIRHALAPAVGESERGSLLGFALTGAGAINSLRKSKRQKRDELQDPVFDGYRNDPDMRAAGGYGVVYYVHPQVEAVYGGVAPVVGGGGYNEIEADPERDPAEDYYDRERERSGIPTGRSKIDGSMG